MTRLIDTVCIVCDNLQFDKLVMVVSSVGWMTGNVTNNSKNGTQFDSFAKKTQPFLNPTDESDDTVPIDPR